MRSREVRNAVSSASLFLPGVTLEVRCVIIGIRPAASPPSARATMIDRYSDHAANERTFLAWVRTAIAIMAFGFLVEKFDLFLEIAGQTLARQPLSVGGQSLGNVAGLILIGLGAVMIILALVRFRRTGREIDSAERIAGSGERLDLALPALLTLIGVALFAYLSYTVISRF
jgi:putative membrane protein